MSATTLDDVLDPQTQAHIHDKLANELSVKRSQIDAFVKLYDDGATVPFIARYRKEQTGGLDDAQLRHLETALNYERDMATRRHKIMQLLHNQGKLTDDLKTRIDNAKSKLELEDIYLPYRPRRRSLSAKAQAAGLDSIAHTILNESISPTVALADYQPPETVTDDTGERIDVDFSDLDKQLAGVQAIIIDEWTQQLDLLDKVRHGFSKTATINASLANEEKRDVGEKFKDYFNHSENLTRLPNHRLLAMLRGRQENVLTLKVDGEDTPFIEQIISHFALNDKQPIERQTFLQETAINLWADKWRPHIEHRLLTEKRLTAEADAINVFANNLKHLLMAAPAGAKVILGVDPGIRHGVKMAVIDAQGHVAKDTNGNPATATVYPFQPDNKVAEAKTTISQLIRDHGVNLVAIGNGTASRETDALIKNILKEDNLTATAIVVNESGASVYSASELASNELGELDVSLRGAVSIARRLQDPLSELVKVDPKAIGVGQYQHDVNQNQLADSLDKVTQDCVNAVGVDVNTASPAILSHIAGLNRNVAQQIITYRQEHGAFKNREQLKNVPRLGVKTFEQAAGFLRIRDGEEPLDATGVHPESYAMVATLLTQAGKSLADVIGQEQALKELDISQFTDNDVSSTENTQTENSHANNIQSVLNELAKPAHDPRPEFKTANFRDDVNDISDLSVSMELEGVVTNVTAFGCFVDVGVHQDGLVHISEMANDFIQDPLNRVKPGDIITVKVLSVDKERRRIGLSMKEVGKEANHSAKDRRIQDGSPIKTDTDHQNKQHSKTHTGRGSRNQSARFSAFSQKSSKTPHHHNKDNHSGHGKNTKSTNTKSNAKVNSKDNANQLGSLGALLKKAGL